MLIHMDRVYCLQVFALLFLLVHHCVGPPAKTKEAGEHNKSEEQKADSIDDFGLEYNRYLKEVVDALESDPEFRKKLETAEEADFRNGKVAAELEYVNHHVRTKLDELKRTELQRLRDLVHQAEEIEKNEVNPDHVNPGHVDHVNPHTFEAADLQKLIFQVRKDLAEADRKRREEFKEYELQKKFEQEQKIKTMDEEHRKQFLHELEEQKKKHQKHDPLHHPGSKAQLEEVWQKEDHMENQKFNPRTFFMLHDINGDGYWDEDELKALFIKELDKLYQAGAPEDDMREREEEMERMREHVFKESDTNGDRLISYEEFLEQTKKDEFNKDEGWETIDSQPQFTQQEYEEFERRRQLEIQQMINQGMLQPYPPGMMPPPPHGYQQHPGQYQQQYPHPGASANQVPQYAQNAAYHPQGVPQAQYPVHGQAGVHQYPAQHYPNQGSNQLPQHSNQGGVQHNQVPISQPAPPHQAQVSNNIGQNAPQGQYQQQQYNPAQQQYHIDPNQIVPNQHASPNQIPNQQVPLNQILNQQVPSNQIPNQQVPSNQIPNQQVPSNQIPNQQVPSNQIPNQQVPSIHLPNQQVPSNHLPNQQVPSNYLPNQQVPSNYLPNQQIPPSNQLPNQQPPSSNQQVHSSNEIPHQANKQQVGQEPKPGSYGSISKQQGAPQLQNQINPGVPNVGQNKENSKH